MDLDILLYGEMLRRADLKLPRPDLLRRAYMLGPRPRLAPDVRAPAWHVTLARWQRQWREASDAADLARLRPVDQRQMEATRCRRSMRGHRALLPFSRAALQMLRPPSTARTCP
jgi:hypothetical protein